MWFRFGRISLLLHIEILVTPITRQYFEADGKIHSDQTEHSGTMRRVAADMKVPLIELQDESIAYLEKAGEEAGHKFEITKKDATGATIYDKTHFNWAGSYVFGRMVSVDLGKAVPGLKKYVRPEAAKLPPEGEKAMRTMEGGPAKIVLVGDSTVATGGGWGPGFCADFTTKIHRGRARDWRSAGAGDVAVAAQLQGWRAGRGPDALC